MMMINDSGGGHLLFDDDGNICKVGITYYTLLAEQNKWHLFDFENLWLFSFSDRYLQF